MQGPGDGTLRPGEIVMRTLFTDFTQQAEKKIESVMLETSVSLTNTLCQSTHHHPFTEHLNGFINFFFY